MSNKPVVSIIVCTHNRASLLKNCLRSLEKQTTDKKNYEVIVVNNNSNDNTQEIVKDFAKDQLNTKVVIEKKQGLSYARNRGWKEAKGIYIAYIDDDAKAEPNWVEQITNFLKTHPKVNVFGGPYDRFSSNPFPSWLPENYFTLNLGNKTKVLSLKNEWLSGSNMVFNKILFYKYGGFKTDLGMQGNKILYGEETEFLLRLKKKGETVYYVPNIRIKHLVAKRKLNLWWLLKNDFWHSYSYSYLRKSKFNILRGGVSLMVSLPLIPIYLIDAKRGVIKRRLYYGLSNIFLSLGQVAGSIYNLKHCAI